MTEQTLPPSATGESLTVARIAEIRRGMRKPKYEKGWATDAEWMAILTLAQDALRAKTTVSEIAPSDACRAALANIMARIDGDEFVPTEYKEDAKKALASFPSAIRQKESDPLSPESIIAASATSSIERKVDEAVSVALRYGGVDGEHHKSWVIDQMVRSLTGERYEEFIRRAKDGVDGPETYGWYEGIAP